MKIQLHPNAEEELYEAAFRYDSESPGLGDELLVEVDHWFEVLSAMPRTWPLWPDAPNLEPPIRRALLNRFPFAIAYQVFGERILVLAIAHTRREPFYWADRTGFGPEKGEPE